ncbi:HNH endonuclease [Pseudonocardiaceae bacterium YIM PH 21723]|nr:HNH endonuclease [Pseudonocardiaceae bacterium YIM PH 21723]
MDREHILTDLARSDTPEAVALAVRYLLAELDPDADAEKAVDRYERRGLDIHESDGFVSVRGYLDSDAGAKLRAALEAIITPAVAGDRDERTAAQKRADALGEICDRALRGGQLPSSGGHKPQIQVTCTLSELRNAGTLTGQAIIDRVGVIDPETLRRIACDCNITRIILGLQGEILDVGRSTRVVPVAIRRAVTVRDMRCSWEGCEMPAEYSDIHHVRHWAFDGETKEPNLALACGHHHTAIHALGDQVETLRRPDGGWTFRKRHGP